MAKSVAEIQDRRTRQYCEQMEALAEMWRLCSTVIAEVPPCISLAVMKYPILESEPKLKHALNRALAECVVLQAESELIRRHHARVRDGGFEARRRGVPITDNPFVEIRNETADAGDVLDGLEEWVVLIKDTSAIAWYIGWKQSVRRGEDVFP